MRPTCLDCVRKHLGQAAVLCDEMAWYPDYKWFVVGHLAEAEAESIKERVELAYKIREARLLFMDTGEISILPLIKAASC